MLEASKQAMCFRDPNPLIPSPCQLCSGTKSEKQANKPLAPSDSAIGIPRFLQHGVWRLFWLMPDSFSIHGRSDYAYMLPVEF